jgi:hypothetical protein
VRKRGAIAFLVIVGVGVAVFLLWPGPEPDTVEWHKAQYRKLYKERGGNTLAARGSRLWRRITRRSAPPQFNITNEIMLSFRIDDHRKALVKMGHLATRDFQVSNSPPMVVLRRVYTAARKVIPLGRLEFSGLSPVHPQGFIITVTGYPEDMAAWGKLIGEADVP